jgi:hypothetical protein
MPKQTIDYSKMPPDAKREKAVQDCKDYINDDKIFKDVVVYCGACQSLEELQGGMAMFMGIEGYPAVAMWETYNNKEIQDGKED